MSPVAANVPASGSYNTALARTVVVLPPSASDVPPAISTIPLASNVAVWFNLVAVMSPAAVNIPASGSYSSALARELPSSPTPPTMSTCPFGNSVAVCPVLAVAMSPVAENVPAAGS